MIARHGLSARKSLGQHFLLDRNLTDRIARAAGGLAQGTVIEIGPGPGGLTRALLAADTQRLVAVEKDPRCREALEELRRAFPERLTLVDADALTVDVRDLGPPPRRIVANLPYNVASALLVQWLTLIAEAPGALADLVLMFQKEVALRLCAAPGGKDYGRLSVLTQWLATPDVLFHVPARAFTPPPKVTSTVLRLTPHARPLHPAPRARLEQVTAAAFGQRRKMLRQSLKTLPVDAGALLAAAAIPGTARAEQLSVSEFCALARALAAMT